MPRPPRKPRAVAGPEPEPPYREHMTVREVAAYLRIKERRVYALVHERAIPCSKVTGKWLFTRARVDEWLRQAGGAPAPVTAPLVVAGSHDPLLEWALRESGSDLALHPGGSLDGLRRLALGQARVCGLHLLDPPTGEYNVWACRKHLPGQELVLVQWAWRRQGLVVAAGDPLGLGLREERALANAAAARVRFIRRQPEAGTHVLLGYLLAREGLTPDALRAIPEVARSQTDVGLAILEGKADAGLAVEAVARQLRLGFIPLHLERYDLALRRREYFEPPFQRLLAFFRSAPFVARAAALGGYDLSGLATVLYNGP